MKVRNPKDRFLKLPRSYKVLDVGGGDNPHRRANVVVEKNPEDNTHRLGDMVVKEDKEYFFVDGSFLPFENQSFDFVFCSHVLEHVEDPVLFMQEQFRIAPRGYLETPSLLGEHLAPKDSHKWVIQEVDGKVVMFDKEKLGFGAKNDFGDLFLDYLPKNSIGYKILERTHPNLLTVRIEWKHGLEILVNPFDNPEYVALFKKPWTEEVYSKYFPEKSMVQELKDALYAMGLILGSLFRSKVLKA
jgi:SAM-dependent methyltransferase